VLSLLALPEGAYKLFQNRLKLVWPEHIEHKFVCPKCGSIDLVELKETRVYSQEVSHVFMFKEGRYVRIEQRSASLDAVEDDADESHLDSFVCPNCEETLALNGQLVT
jgi:predicted RNA-binding Zn-ribbon protein involved in translation (DUF1610 family)